MKPICPYCANVSELVSGNVVYPHRKDLHAKPFWRCEPCGAYVGCHPNTERPLGRLADAQLRKAKMRAHAAFDPIWKLRKMNRSSAYHWLSKQLGIPQSETHIGMMDAPTCERVVSICSQIR